MPTTAPPTPSTLAGLQTPRPAAAPEPSARLRLLMVLAVYAVPVVVAVRPVADPLVDPDIWWHLRVGQWVVEHSAVPEIDPFSQAGRPWVAYSWLYEVLLYGLASAFGLWGVVLYRAALAVAVAAAVHALVARRERRFLPALALTGAAAFALAPLFSERPWLFTILFSTLTLDAVLELRAGRLTWRAWLLPAVFALWANIHIQFIYGLLILGLGVVGPVLDRALRRGADEGNAPGSPAWARLVALTAACALATLVNPYHVRLYGVVLEYATQPGPFRFVNELKALEFREPSDWVVLGLVGGAAFALGRRRPGPAAFDVLLLAAAAFFTFRAQRDLWFGTLAALAVLASAGPGGARADERFDLTPRRLGWLALGLALLAGVTALARGLSPSTLERKVAGVFPAEAAAVVAERGYEGPLYNDFNWGGYLIWRLPHLPVAIDGRTNLHGDERIVRFGSVWAGGTGWRDDPDLQAAGVVVAPADAPLAGLLRDDPRFVLAHEDEVAKVFVRRR